MMRNVKSFFHKLFICRGTRGDILKKDKAALLASAGALAAAWAALQLAPHGENLACFFTGLGFGMMAGAIFLDAEKGTK